MDRFSALVIHKSQIRKVGHVSHFRSRLHSGPVAYRLFDFVLQLPLANGENIFEFEGVRCVAE